MKKRGPIAGAVDYRIDARVAPAQLKINYLKVMVRLISKVPAANLLRNSGKPRIIVYLRRGGPPLRT